MHVVVRVILLKCRNCNASNGTRNILEPRSFKASSGDIDALKCRNYNASNAQVMLWNLEVIRYLVLQVLLLKSRTLNASSGNSDALEM
jgi:hypothetical protein